MVIVGEGRSKAMDRSGIGVEGGGGVRGRATCIGAGTSVTLATSKEAAGTGVFWGTRTASAAAASAVGFRAFDSVVTFAAGAFAFGDLTRALAGLATTFFTTLKAVAIGPGF